MQILIGIIIGIAVCTLGVRGCVDAVDNGVSKVQQVMKDVSK